MNARLFPLALPLCLSLACSSKSNDSTSSPSTSGPEGGTGTTWTRLIEGEWTLGPGEEKTRYCVKKELTEDLYVKAIRPIHPKGTHHTLLTLGDGTIDCTTAVAQGLIYAAGVGSEGLTLPEGVAIKLPKGKFLNLGLHLYNTSEDTLEGTSAMEVQFLAKEDVKFESEALLAGPLTLSLPPGKETTVSNECDITDDQTMYALFPHMHQLGKHLKTTFTVGGVEQVIHDGDYTFNEQFQIPLDPQIALHPGDKVKTECTYDNTLDKTVTFGESSDTEMCFSILFRYPALGRGFCGMGSGSTTPPALPGPACAAAGAAGNEIGVGKQCSKGGNECVDNKSADVCLADYTTGDFGNFCTFLCQTNADCGTGAACQGNAGRAVCIPNACIAAKDGGAAPSDGG
ncbi:MAG TPA: hypothetical protein VHE30_04480 [Polyangiaceae bacterium]|nr:hypothetical protein [Polyangiaceae bacterium]